MDRGNALFSKRQTTSFWRKRKRKTLGRLRLAEDRQFFGLGELRAERSSCSLNQVRFTAGPPVPADSLDPCESLVTGDGCRET